MLHIRNCLCSACTPPTDWDQAFARLYGGSPRAPGPLRSRRWRGRAAYVRHLALLPTHRFDAVLADPHNRFWTLQLDHGDERLFVDTLTARRRTAS